MQILGICGSLRKQSYNRSLLQAAADLAPGGMTLEVAGLEGIPLYNGDVEKSGFPEPVAVLKERVIAAEGLLVATPEYNSSMPGVLKNAFDWLSRPGSDIPRVFGGKPAGLIGASTGARATQLAQAAWLPVFRALKLQLWTEAQLNIGGAAALFDAEGNLTDAATRERVAKYMAGFARFVAGSRHPPSQ